MTSPLAEPISSHETRKWAWVTAFVLLGLYLLLQNRYWVPGGDSDFYVACARSIVTEGEFSYNGNAVAISPPGWPFVMAMLMKVSPTFLLLKLSTMGMMLGSLVISYFIALRFLSPRWSCLAIVTTGLLIPVYSLTYFLHSEALFCLLSAGALLIAMRIREGRHTKLEWFGLFAIAMCIPLVRWSGIIQLLPICAVLIPRAKYRALILCGTAAGLIAIVLATFVISRHLQEPTVEQEQVLKEEGPVLDAAGDAESKSVALVPTGGKEQSLIQEYSERFLRSGLWFSWFFWQPTRFLSVNKYLNLAATLLGWVVVLILLRLVLRSIVQRQWLWPALAIYTAALCMNWPNPNSRYFVPVAPLLTIAVIVGVQTMLRNKPQRLVLGLFIIATLFNNLAMYAVDVYVMRAPNFGEHFEAGQHKDLVNIAHFLGTWPTPPGDGQIMVNDFYENLNRARNTPAGPRAMILLTNRKVRTLTRPYTKPTAPTYRVWKYAYQKRSYYLLVQNPSVPWRVWHFKLPMSLYQKLAKDPKDTPSGGWRLRVRVDDPANEGNGHFQDIPFPADAPWPTRVPGM